jgi:hypothetical protein
VGLLADPSDPDRMYLETGGISIARPLMFGDVISGVPCSRGGDPSDYVMLMTHPCSMRRGPNLRETIVTATIEESKYTSVKAEKWADSVFDFVPLYDFRDAGAQQVVNLAGLHAAASGDLNVKNRVLALSDYGIAVVLQRWIYQLSRDPVPLEDLAELIAPILAEADIQEAWCEAALKVAEGDTDAVVTAATAEVQELLGPPSGDTYRTRLKDAAERSSVRRAIAKLRIARYGDSA